MNKQVVIVTGNQAMLELGNKLSEDLQVTVVATPEEGMVALATPSTPEIVIADFRLPDMTGAEFLLRASEKTDAVTFLLALPEDLAEALTALNQNNFYRLLSTACTVEELETAVFDGLRQHRLIRQELQLRERIRELAVTDALTGSLSRPHGLERLKAELHRSTRYAHSLSIILCDIDNLAKVNERYDYQTGDRILTGFAQNAAQLMRRDLDLICRWEGDGFLIILPETAIRGAGSLAQRIRAQFALMDFRAEMTKIRATASFGVAGYTPENPERNHQVDDLLLIADRCLNQSISAGGNTVLCCP